MLHAARRRRWRRWQVGQGDEAQPHDHCGGCGTHQVPDGEHARPGAFGRRGVSQPTAPMHKPIPRPATTRRSARAARTRSAQRLKARRKSPSRLRPVAAFVSAAAAFFRGSGVASLDSLPTRIALALIRAQRYRGSIAGCERPRLASWPVRRLADRCYTTGDGDERASGGAQEPRGDRRRGGGPSLAPGARRLVARMGRARPPGPHRGRARRPASG